jgi:uncharacterized protein (DUF885 family)
VRRRDLLTNVLAGASALSLPARALARPADGDHIVRAALDSLAALPTPAAKLARLASLDSDGLSHSAALDLLTVRQGLAVDARLVSVFPFGRLGHSPYVVSEAGGAWRSAGKPDADAGLAARIDGETRAIIDDARHDVVLPQPFLDRAVATVRKAAAESKGDVATALDRQAATLAGLGGKSGQSPGIWQFPNGGDYLALLLDRHAGEQIDIAALHDRLTAKWHALAARADRLLRAQGLADGSVGQRFIAYFRRPEGLYPDSSAGRDQAVADMNRTLDRARDRVPALIGPVPPFCLAVRAQRMSPADEAAGRGGYRTVATATTPGGYFVDLFDIKRRPRWSLGSVVHHELLPGHMIQLPIEAAANPHPLRLEYAPAFAEGWGVYAEQLAADDGAFAGNDPMLLGHIHWLLFRIGRGVIDTGIHYARWSRQKALETLEDVQGEPAYFAPFATDIDRICLEPGIRAAEALTWLRLVDLRDQAAGKQRSPKAIRRFHQRVLMDGRKRLEMIEAQAR